MSCFVLAPVLQLLGVCQICSKPCRSVRGDLQVLEGLRRGTEDDPSYKAHSGNEDPKGYGAPSRLHSAGLALQLLI